MSWDKKVPRQKGKTALEQIYDTILVSDSGDECCSLQSENLQDDDPNGNAFN